MRMHTLWLAALLGLAGCSTTPDWDAGFGDTVRQARAAQLVDPDAASRSATPGGLDGKAIAGTMKAYARSFGYFVYEPSPPLLVPVLSSSNR